MRDMDVPSKASPLALAALAALLLAAVGLRWAFAQGAPDGAVRPPAPLPAGIKSGQSDAALGALQRAYRRADELGLDEEAAKLAERLGAVRRTEDAVPADRGHARWADCRTQPATFRFEGASAAEVARFVRGATGLEVRVLPGADPAAGFHGEARGKPLGEALALLGAEVRPDGAGLAIAPLAPLALRMAGEPLRR